MYELYLEEMFHKIVLQGFCSHQSLRETKERRGGRHGDGWRQMRLRYFVFHTIKCCPLLEQLQLILVQNEAVLDTFQGRLQLVAKRSFVAFILKVVICK